MMGSSGQRLTHLINRLGARAQMKGAVIVAKARCGRTGSGESAATLARSAWRYLISLPPTRLARAETVESIDGI